MRGERHGITLRAVQFEPTFHKHCGRTCGGLFLHPASAADVRSYAWTLQPYRVVDEVVAVTPLDAEVTAVHRRRGGRPDADHACGPDLEFEAAADAAIRAGGQHPVLCRVRFAAVADRAGRAVLGACAAGFTARSEQRRAGAGNEMRVGAAVCYRPDLATLNVGAGAHAARAEYAA